MISDRGSCYTSELMSEVNRLLSIKKIHTTPYYPMSNWLFERFNRTLKRMLLRMCQEQPRSWNRYISPLLFAYRKVPQTSLEFSPFEVIYNHSVRGPVTVLRELCTNYDLARDTKTTYEHVLDLRNRLEETCKLTHEKLEKARFTQKKYFYFIRVNDTNYRLGIRGSFCCPRTKIN